MNRQWYYIIVGLIASIIFYFSNENLRGYLKCDACLGKEIQSHQDSLYQYKLSNKAPFKYRILFPVIVKTSHKIFFKADNSLGFYYTYKFWSWFFYICAACLVFKLMHIASFNDWLCFTGAVIFVLLPPMLMAYTLPVHTREDPLAYTILLLGLISLVQDKKWLFVLISIAGALCRETLLLLPMLYFFFSDDKNIVRRLTIPALPCFVWLTLRLAMGQGEYDIWEGFNWNNNNPEQVIGFLFVTFNVLWLAFVFHLAEYKKKLQSNNKIRVFFYRSSILTVLVILSTTYFGGIYNEIRLLYLLAPWMILIGLDFLEQYGVEMKNIMATTRYLVFIFFATVLCAVVMFFTFKYQDVLIVPGKYAVPYHLWIIVSVIYFNITIIFAPVSVKLFLSRRIENV
jgi:hypothetical protein